jgi:MoxR-like ATPase
MKIAEVEAGCREVLNALSRIIVGKDDVLRRLLAGILANGHILIEDYPGLAKTLIARLLSEAFDLQFRRVQFTPDLLPGDITGSFLYDQREGRFEFRRGPIFTQLLLADEINRATPKTQSALLEAMQEGQVTVEGQSYPLDTPFLVIATQNPIDLEGTYPLPEAQLDRFMMRIAVGYPGREEEREILSRRQARRTEEAHLHHVVSRDQLLAMQQALENVHVDRSIEEYIVDIARATREEPRVALGASPRGTLALLKLARAMAALRRRDFVTPDDVKVMAVPALGHRLMLRPELWVSNVDPADIVQDILSKVPTPSVVAA